MIATAFLVLFIAADLSLPSILRRLMPEGELS